MQLTILITNSSVTIFSDKKAQQKIQYRSLTRYAQLKQNWRLYFIVFAHSSNFFFSSLPIIFSLIDVVNKGVDYVVATVIFVSR